MANRYFQAQVYDKASGKLEHLGVFDTDTQARDAIETHTRLAAGSQRNRTQKRPATGQRVHRKKCCRKSIEEHVKGFGFMTKVYTEENGEPAVPEDLTASVKDRLMNEAAIVEVPAFHFFWLMGKDGPIQGGSQ